jgi:type II secretory pathway pseudopilin PulG
MFRRTSETRLSLLDNGQEGTTLVALLIALAISGILLIGLMRLFNTSLKSYKLEEKDLDMQRTAVLVLDRLSEDIQQAGSGMPPEDTGLTINSTGTWIFIRSNPWGAYYYVMGYQTSATHHYVANAVPFLGIKNLIWEHWSNGSPVFDNRPISTGKNGGFWIYGVDTTEDSISLWPSSDSLSRNDVLYARASNTYSWDNSAKIVTRVIVSDTVTYTDTIAYNVDNLAAAFFDNNHSKLSSPIWTNIKQCSLFVSIKAPFPDRNYNGYADHCRRTNLSKKFMLRNRIAL